MLPLKDCKVTSPYGVERIINGVKSVHKGTDLISNFNVIANANNKKG